ncbi:MAG TPA: D-2-hydroxyacid dehydrogenase [Burkholderiales bacterium]|nr:D-2-hydroxyacid dehydrogenase [Burkholderiales bacterium]
MSTAFVSRQFVARFGPELKAAAERAGDSLSFMTAPGQPGARLSQAECDRIDFSFMDRDIRFDPPTDAAYGAAIMASKTLKWVHVTSSSALQLPYIPLLDHGRVTVTTSTGSNAEPVAQTGFTGLLMLARGFPQYIEGQHRHEWCPLRGASLPDDLRGQTVVLIGVGAVGKTFARYAQAFGLRVIGVRRSRLQPGDPVDELHPPSRLRELLPRADWIVICCPLTKETRRLIDAETLKHIRKGARLVNIARGEIVDEAALIDALRSGQLAGAALDAHSKEPLPADSPLWDLPNVIVSPHNASASNGNEKRCAEMFIANYGHWIRGEPMFNVQQGWRRDAVTK